MFYIHKYDVALQYGGPEEGGWWFDTGVPCEDYEPWPFMYEDAAYEMCRRLNDLEHERAIAEESYDYTSVLASHSDHYSYSVESSSVAESYPSERPHYE